MNTWAAATRLALYWKHRREIFGEKWLRPILDLSGQGALNETDVECLRAGVVAVRNHPPIIYVDMNKAPKTRGTTFPARMSFYLAALFNSDEAVQNDGVYIVNKLAPLVHFKNKKKQGRVWELSRNALPIRLKKVFILKPADSVFAESLIRTCFSVMGMSIQFFLGSSPEFLFESDRDDSVRKLLSAGVPTDCIAFCLGTSWDGNFLPIATQQSTASPTTSGNDNPRRKRGRPPKTNVETALEEVRENAQGQDDFLRRRNAFYSRRLYQRRKKEVAGVEGKVNRLKEEQQRLKEENKRLNELLSEARMTITLYEEQNRTLFTVTSTARVADFAL